MAGARQRLLAVLAANEQSDADDPASKEFLKAYEPARDVVLGFFEALTVALEDAYSMLDGTRRSFVAAEEDNIAAAHALGARVSRVR
ncbi:hypothetical protein [Streptomyces sp. ADI93-02]|uniref:hypothetical protein n=1 Tax=Streptomyces sp. ADI93-02 TaxID=1522757 RepID=UPI000F551CA7|nr:hypothetical protein [Streptomyces sp. ADI93-02]